MFLILKYNKNITNKLRNLSINHLLKQSYCSSAKKFKKILFFGTDNFSLPSLKILHQEVQNNGIVKELGVVTSFKSAKNPVKMYAQADPSIKLFKYPLEFVKHDYDLGVVVSFGYLLPKEIIDSFPLGMINVHASLLPRWRGAAPIIYSIMNGEKSTGVTIMKIHPFHFDVGEILYQDELEIERHDKLPELHSKLANLGAVALLKSICRLECYYHMARSQLNAEATYAPKVDKNLPIISWSNMTATQVYNLYRALYGYKHLQAEWHGQPIKIINVEPVLDSKLIKFSQKMQSLSRPGLVEYSKRSKCLLVECANQTIIKVLDIQVEGKKIMSAIEFHNGFMQKLTQKEHYFT